MSVIDIKYRIISMNESEHTIVVRYYTDVMTEHDLRVDDRVGADGKPLRCRTDYNLTVWDSITTEEDLHKMIETAMPVNWFRLQHSIIEGTNTDKISMVTQLLDTEFKTPVPAVQPSSNTA